MQDRDGGILLLATLFGMYPFLQTLFADAGYQGPKFHNALRTILPHLETQIVKRSDQKRFTVLPKRWIVERSQGRPDPGNRVVSLARLIWSMPSHDAIESQDLGFQCHQLGTAQVNPIASAASARLKFELLNSFRITG